MVTKDELKAGTKIRVDFTGGSKEKDLDEGVLLGEVISGLWVARFEKRGMLVMGVDRFGDLGFDEGMFDQEQMVVNPTAPSDWSQEELVIILQLSEGKLLNEDLDVEGGLFPITEVL